MADLGGTPLASFTIATWSDGSIVQSVLIPGQAGIQHEYWIVQDGQVLARCPSLAAVDEWRMGVADGHPYPLAS